MGPNDPSKKYFDVAKPRSAPANSGTAPILNNPKRQMINIGDGEKPPEESGPISNIDDENQPYDDTLMDQPEASEPSAEPLAHPELVLPTDNKNDDQSEEDGEVHNDESKENDAKQANEDTPFVNPLPGTIEEEKPPEEVVEEPEPEEEKAEEQETKQEPKADKSAGEKVVKPLEDSENKDQPIEEKPQPDTPAPPPERFSAIDALPEEEKTTEEVKEGMQDPSIYDTKEYYVPIGNTHHSHGGLKMAFAFGLLCAVIVVGAIIFYMLNIAK